MATLAPKLPYTHPFAGGYPGRGSQRLPSDPDALAYLAAVAAADGAAVEVGVAMAVDDFIRGCKADGIWDAIKASCILCGARTISGALVPLVGAAPTNNNFVAADYNRETGLLGNGTSKYLTSNRNNNAEPQNSKHLSVYVSAASTGSASGRTYIGSVIANGSSWLHGAANTNLLSVRANTATSVFDLPDSSSLTGFVGVLRNSDSANTVYRYSGSSSSAAAASVSPATADIEVYRGTTSTSFSDARMSFYSIGEAIDLALLDAHVSALITAIGNAI